MLDIQFLLDLVSTGAIVIGVVFGLTQLRHYHLSRKRDAALHLLNSYQTGEFLQGIWSILSIPNGSTKKEVEDKVGDDIKDVYLVMSTWESLGILVFQKEISMDMVDAAYSGPITLSWLKLEAYVYGVRAELQRETMFEWFQWLAERMLIRERKKPPVPAHIAHKDWEE